MRKNLASFIKNKIYLLGAVCITVVFLMFLLMFGSAFFPISTTELINIIAGGTVLALVIIITPHLIYQAKKDLKKKRKRNPKQYTIQLVTNDPPEYSSEVLSNQIKRINLIIKDLNNLCEKCLTRKCSKCSIKREILPTLEKIKEKMGRNQ